jgi:hypothetical protein
MFVLHLLIVAFAFAEQSHLNELLMFVLHLLFFVLRLVVRFV